MISAIREIAEKKDTLKEVHTHSLPTPSKHVVFSLKMTLFHMRKLRQ